MPGRHQRKIFAPPLGTAIPNTVYTGQRRPGAPQPFLEALSTAPASTLGAWSVFFLRLPIGQYGPLSQLS